MDTKQISQFLDSLEGMLTQNEVPEQKGVLLGVIESNKDGVLEISGLSELRMGELVSVQNLNVEALVLNLEHDRAYALVLQPTTEIKEGMFVESRGRTLSIPVSEGLIGRVIDSLGNVLDGSAKSLNQTALFWD